MPKYVAYVQNKKQAIIIIIYVQKRQAKEISFYIKGEFVSDHCIVDRFGKRLSYSSNVSV